MKYRRRKRKSPILTFPKKVYGSIRVMQYPINGKQHIILGGTEHNKKHFPNNDVYLSKAVRATGAKWLHNSKRWALPVSKARAFIPLLEYADKQVKSTPSTKVVKRKKSNLQRIFQRQKTMLLTTLRFIGPILKKSIFFIAHVTWIAIVIGFSLLEIFSACSGRGGWSGSGFNMTRRGNLYIGGIKIT